MSSCCVVIPVYKSYPNRDDLHSLQRCLKVLCHHDIILVTFKDLDISYYYTTFRHNKVCCRCEFFEKYYFENIAGYNKLMLSEEFYQRFSSYCYILLYQLDAYIFKDELSKWCNSNYSYVGAPLPNDLTTAVEIGHNEISKYIITLKRTFNGGASLRKTVDFITAIQHNQETIQGWYNDGLNEDIIFSALFLNEEHPTEEEAREFSFDMFPKEEYERNNKRLPMMCHGWTKSKKENHVYNRGFWIKYIWPAHYVCYKVTKYAHAIINCLK